MTEKDFLRQVWRPYDQITTCDGIPGKVLQVAFNTKSVRAFISGAPEWVSCTLIESHTTARGGNAEEADLIEQLQKKLDSANARIETQKENIRELEEKLAKNYAGDLLRNVNVILNVVREKKARAGRMEACMEEILAVIGKMEQNNIKQEEP